MPIAKAVKAENHSLNVNKVAAIIQTKTVFMKLVVKAGLSLPLILGSRATIKKIWATEITISCQRI